MRASRRAVKLFLLNSNISSTCPRDTVNFGPLSAEIGLPVWGTPPNFNGLRVLAALLQRRRSTEANQTLHDVWPSPDLVHYDTLNHKKRDILFLTVTLANLNRFLYFYIILIVKKFYIRL